ncbi:GIY-YIG nuclease family protein [Geodermatophilus sp. SYSU D01106]
MFLLNGGEVGSGRRRTFVRGEQVLSDWMAEHDFVSIVEHPRPWELENELIVTLDVPLNLEGNAFHAGLTEVRRRAGAAGNERPIVPNPRIGGH